jgi:flagellum-specific ATP synthase/type III secretion protein N (ATPase)
MKVHLSLDAYHRKVETAQVHRPTGVVLDVVGLVVEVGGLRAGVGDLLFILREGHRELPLEVVGFRTGRLLATPLGPVAGVRPGARVVRSERGPVVAVGPALLGRVVDSFGQPLDGNEVPQTAESYPIHAPPPAAFSRRPIDQALCTGVRAIDGLLTLGSGQRVGIFAGAGVGKSTLLGMICRSSEADINVIGLVGERGREVNDFIRGSLGPEGLARSVVVAATSDQPPLVRARGAETATAIAEYFRDQGKSVLLVMDSVTRYAMSLRETALATGEPPATKGYPPSVFAALPRLLERAGTSGGPGVITALYTVLVEGDDMSDPIADAVRSILDGHIVLSRKLGERGHYPAIDVLQSISRLAPQVASGGQLKASTAIRDLISAYREALDLIQVGAYVPGSDPRVDTACRAMPDIDVFLRQGIEERTDMAATQTVLAHLARYASGGNA